MATKWLMQFMQAAESALIHQNKMLPGRKKRKKRKGHYAPSGDSEDKWKMPMKTTLTSDTLTTVWSSEKSIHSIRASGSAQQMEVTIP